MTGLFGTPDVSIQNWLNELKAGLKSIVIFSKEQSSLDQAALEIRDRWTEDRTHTLDEFDADNYTILIDRLNALVTEKSTTIAGQTAAPGSRISLWLIHNSQALNPEQLLLLGQMLIHLPGLNLRMVLLHRGEKAPAQWETATRNQTRLLEYTPEPIEPELFADITESFNSAPIDTTGHSLPTQPQTAPTHVAKPIRWHRAILKQLILALGFLTVGWVLGSWTSGKAAKPALQIEATQTAATAVQQATPLTEVSTPPPMTSAVEDKVGPPLAEPVTQAITAAPAAAAGSPVPPTRIETVITESAVDEKAPPFVMLRGDIQWLKGLSPEHFVIAHGTFRSLENAQKMKRRHSELSQSRIVPVLVSRKVAYAVVTGPFKNQDRANNNLKRLAWASVAKVMQTSRAQRLVNAAIKHSD